MKQNHIISNHIRLFFLISAAFLIPGILSLIFFRLRPSIDFTGGSVLTVQVGMKTLGDFPSSKVKQLIGKDASLMNYRVTAPNQFELRLNPIDASQKDKVMDDLRSQDANIHELQFETVGPTLGKELITKTVVGVLLAILLITIYLAFRFPSWQYGVCASLAALHDVLIVLGVFSLLGHFARIEVDILFVTALLTILAFSLHDTLIVYDRIRERLSRHLNTTFEAVVDAAVRETINRSIRNSLAVLLMLLMVFLLGGDTIRWFVFALLVGTITGTYSSTCVALPLLILWERRKSHRR